MLNLNEAKLLSPELLLDLDHYATSVNHLRLRLTVLQEKTRQFQSLQQQTHLALREIAQCLTDAIADVNTLRPSEADRHGHNPSQFGSDPEAISLFTRVTDTVANKCTSLSRSFERLSKDIDQQVCPIIEALVADGFANIQRLQQEFFELQKKNSQCTDRYARLSESKPNVQRDKDIAMELRTSRRAIQLCTLDFMSELAIVPKRWQCVVLNAMRSMIRGCHTFVLESHTNTLADVLEFDNATRGFVDECETMHESIKRYIDQERTKIEKETLASYDSDIASDDPMSAPLPTDNSDSKPLVLHAEGYLHVYNRPLSWKYWYCVIDRGHLRIIAPKPVIINLIGCKAAPIKKSDRRHTFEVVSASNARTILQAESLHQRDTWISCVNQAARDVSALLDSSGNSSSAPFKVVYFRQARETSSDESDSGHVAPGHVQMDASSEPTGSDELVWLSLTNKTSSDRDPPFATSQLASTQSSCPRVPTLTQSMRGPPPRPPPRRNPFAPKSEFDIKRTSATHSTKHSVTTLESSGNLDPRILEASSPQAICTGCEQQMSTEPTAAQSFRQTSLLSVTDLQQPGISATATEYMFQQGPFARNTSQLIANLSLESSQDVFKIASTDPVDPIYTAQHHCRFSSDVSTSVQPLSDISDPEDAQ
jgi:hypothetical protein